MNTLVAVDELELLIPSTSPGLGLEAFTTPCFCRSGGGTQGFMPGCKCSAHRAEPLVLFHWAGISTRYTFQSENLGFLHLLLACKQATLLGGVYALPSRQGLRDAICNLGCYQTTITPLPPQLHRDTYFPVLGRSRFSNQCAPEEERVCLPGPCHLACRQLSTAFPVCQFLF